METERIALNQRERERLKVTVRQVRRLLLALAERGDGAMVHGLRGRASNRKLETSFEQRILTGYGGGMRTLDRPWPRSKKALPRILAVSKSTD